MREISPSGGSERCGACDDEGDIAEYPGMKAFFNLR